MARSYHIPGIISLFCALILLFLTAVSLPYLTSLDAARVKISGGSPTVGSDSRAVKEIRFGTWGTCWYMVSTDGHACSPAGVPYTTTVFNSGHKASVTIDGGFTQGLVVHPIATAITLVALALSFSRHTGFTLLASVLAAVLAVVSFGMDMMVFAWAKHQMSLLESVSSSTETAPGLWATIVASFLLIFASGTVCLGRRRDRKEGAHSWRERYRDS
ncbi:hypothetical protein C8Q79DRAFT_427385 [Trametes meyenii]|nr:hypothetical protein C8Q79DRAFT_427385 [Trametes meyenii]